MSTCHAHAGSALVVPKDGRISRRRLSHVVAMLLLMLAAADVAGAQNPLKTAREKLEEVRRKAEQAARDAERARQRRDSSATAGSPVRGAAASPASPGAGTTRSSAKVEEELLLEGEPGMTFYVSPQGQHVVAAVPRGSRVVVAHDGVDGPRFDEICPCGIAQPPAIAFSDDGSRYAYHARAGQEIVFMAGTQELVRVPVARFPLSQFQNGTFSAPSFDASGKRVWFELRTTPPANGNASHMVFVDGKPGPAAAQSIGEPVFSPDGSRFAYVMIIATPSGPSPVLVVDGRPAAYVAGAPQFSGDGKSLYTKRTLPNGGGEEVLLDGRPWMRAAQVRLHTAPAGSLVLGVLNENPRVTPPTYALTLGNRKVAGGECVGASDGGIDVFFSDDGARWAARCNSPVGSWVMVDGRKGQSYQQIGSEVRFTADGRPVYQAMSNGRVFLVVGDEESDGYVPPLQTEPDALGQAKAAVMAGRRVGFIGQRPADGGAPRTVVIDGKASTAAAPSDLRFSPDGSRYAFVTGAIGASGHWLVVDGTEWRGLMMMDAPRTRASSVHDGPRYTFSADGRHVAYFAFPAWDNTARGVAIDGRFFPVPNVVSGGNVSFSADGRHVFWLANVRGAPRQVLFVDGEPALELPADARLFAEAYRVWSPGADGTLTILAQDGSRLKRYRITPAATTSVETVLGRAIAPR